MRCKVAIRFAIGGDLRFISHHDTMRLFERALLRAGVPTRFSAGFNPRPRLSLPVPRPVGMASECELLVVELHEAVGPEQVRQSLAGQLPAGVQLRKAWALEPRELVQPVEVLHSLRLVPAETAKVADALHRLMAAPTWPVDRQGSAGRPGKVFDLRAHLTDARVEGDDLHWTVRVTPQGCPRPGEFLAVIGLEPATWRHRIRRMAVRWRNELLNSSPAPAGSAY